MILLIGLIACIGALYFGSRRDWTPTVVCALVALGTIPSSVTAVGMGVLMPIVPIACVIIGIWWMVGRPRRARG